jgi:hypothetical protein
MGSNPSAIMALLERKLSPVLMEIADIVVEVGAERMQKRLDRPFPPASKVGEYPKRRTRSLQSSVGVTKAVKHGNIYSAKFGVIHDNIVRRSRSVKNQVEKDIIDGIADPPTMYAKYLARSGRKMTKAALREIIESGRLKSAINEGLQKFRGAK